MLDRVTALLTEIRVVLGDMFVDPTWRRVAFFLLPYVGVLAGMDVAAHYGSATNAPLPAQMFLSKDESFGEYLEYTLTAAMAVMLFLMWRQTRAGIYLVNALLFVYLTADNSMQFHEQFGHFIAPMLPVPADFPLPANDVGESLLFVIIGVTWLISLAFALRTAQLRPAAHALILAVGIAGAAGFGIIADAVTSWGDKSVGWISFEAWLEDGGEFVMIVATFLACVAMFSVERRRAARPASQ